MIRTTAVTKRYGPVLAVDEVDLDVREGDRYGLLGPNGSGKTTLVRMLLGLVFATAGEIEVLGPAGARSRSRGCCRRSARWSRAPPGTGTCPAARTCVSSTRPARRARASDGATAGTGWTRCWSGSASAASTSGAVKAYSLGMRQRLGLAAALLRRPRLLILDEPTNGLDPRGIREIRDLLVELNEAGTTVFLSSHLLSEVEQLATRVGVMDRGRLVLQEYLAELRGTDRPDRGAHPGRWPGDALCWTAGSSPARRTTWCWSATTTRPRSTRCWSPTASG